MYEKSQKANDQAQEMAAKMAHVIFHELPIYEYEGFFALLGKEFNKLASEKAMELSAKSKELQEQEDQLNNINAMLLALHDGGRVSLRKDEDGRYMDVYNSHKKNY